MDAVDRSPRLPNFVVAGVNRAGTTSLFSYLAQHPDACPSSVKETCFFLPLRYGEVLPPLQRYERYFSKHRGEHILFEATPGYFYGGARLASHIQDVLGNPRVLVLLRNPTDRFVSAYRHFVQRLELSRSVSLGEYLERCQSLTACELRKRENNVNFGLEGGFYARYITAWQEVFGSRLRVEFFEDLASQPAQFMRRLCAWLGLDTDPCLAFDYERSNQSRLYRFRSLQRVANELNRRAEPMLRSNPRLKSLLARAYDRLNSVRQATLGDSETLRKLNSIYERPNVALSALLTEVDSRPHPEWLRLKH